MKQLVMAGNRRIDFVDKPDPQPEGEWVIVRMDVSPLCGSELGSFRKEQPSDGFGHEGIGTVVAVDEDHGLKPGMRVMVNPGTSCGVCPVCRSGEFIHCRQDKPPMVGHHHAHFVRKQAHLLVPIPDDMPSLRASLLGCGMGPAYNAVDRMNLQQGQTLLITGAGPVGLGATMIAADRGANAIVVEPNEYRQQLAMRLGATHTVGLDNALDAIKDLTRGEGVDCAFDATGKEPAERLCLDAAGVRGQVTFAGENYQPIELRPSPDLLRRGITLHGVWQVGLKKIPEMLDVLRRQADRADAFITHTFPFEEAQAAYDVFDAGEAGKVVLVMHE